MKTAVQEIHPRIFCPFPFSTVNSSFKARTIIMEWIKRESRASVDYWTLIGQRSLMPEISLKPDNQTNNSSIEIHGKMENASD